MTTMWCSRPNVVASSETLPPPNERCIHTLVMPRFDASRTVSSAYLGLVPTTTASTPPGMDRRSG